MKCIVCFEREGSMCPQCGKAYDRSLLDGASAADLIEWAAKRARWFAEKRAKENMLRAKSTYDSLLRNIKERE